MRTVLLLSLLFPALAVAGENDAALRAEATKELNLSFDYDSVSQQLAMPAAAPPAPAPGRSASPYAPAVPMQRVAPLPLVANSDVAEVTVYRDRAIVTRDRVLDLGNGETAVSFTGLPLDLDPSSLQAGVDGAGDAEVLAVERLTGEGLLHRQEEQERIRALLRPLVDQVGQSRDRIEALLAQRDYLRGAVLPKGDHVERAPVADMQKTLAFIAEQETAIAAALRGEQTKVEDLDRKIHPLLVELGDPNADGEKVVVHVHTGKATKGTISLKYQVFGASWTPAYNARLPVDGGKVALEVAGVVAQGTGEDWTKAKLHLSTADASTPGNPPDLSTWYLAGNDGTLDAEANTPSNGWNDNNKSAPIGAPAGHTAVVFDVPGTWTVHGDGSEQRLPIAVMSLDATEARVTVPRTVPLVYRKVAATYNGALPLLAGPIDLFVGPDQVATASLPGTAPGETLKLYFGGDQGTKVQRHLVERHQEYLGVGKKTVRYTFKYKIEIKNYRDVAEDVLVADQIPVAANDRITVKLLDGTTPANAVETDDPAGILKWKVSVPPGGTQTIEVGFQVTAPADSMPRLMEMDEMM